MGNIKKVVKKDTLFLSFVSTIVIVSIGYFTIPLAFRNIKNTEQVIVALLVGVIFMFLFLVGSTQVLWYRLRLHLELEPFKIQTGWKKTAGCIAMLIFGWVVLALVYGIIAVSLYLVTKDTMTLGQVKGIFNFVSTTISALILPCSIHLLYRQGLRPENAKEGPTLKQTYLKILGIVLLLYAVGHLIAVGFLYIESTVFMECIKIVILSMVGSIAIVLLGSLYGEERK